MNKCQFCEQEASKQEVVTPAMCEKHLDLAVLASYLVNKGLPPTVEAMTGLYEQAKANNGWLAITAADIAEMMVAPFTDLFKVGE